MITALSNNFPVNVFFNSSQLGDFTSYVLISGNRSENLVQRLISETSTTGITFDDINAFSQYVFSLTQVHKDLSKEV